MAQLWLRNQLYICYLYTYLLFMHSSTQPQLQSQYKVSSYLTGDVIGIHVTSFSREKSSVMILKNGHPVCTKYHYEQDHQQFYPTIVLEHGPIDLTVTWQNAVTSFPQYDYVS